MPTAADVLDQLGPVFRWREARRAGLSDPALHRLLAEGRLERISHGLYLQVHTECADVVDLDLVVVAAANHRSTLCLASALVRHDLTDEIPIRVDVALPRGTRLPKVSSPVRWHRFASATFDLGRDEIAVAGGYTIGLYSPERSIVDAYRLRHLEGDQLGREALKVWLRQRGSQPSRLLQAAAPFPKALGRLREDMRLLL